MLIGFNYGNAMDAWTGNYISSETGWGNADCEQSYFSALADNGFKTVRIPISWMNHIGAGPDYKIDETWIARVKQLVDYVNNAGMIAIINLHHDGCKDSNSGSEGWLSISKASTSKAQCDSITQKFAVLWTNIATYFKDYSSDKLIF